MDTKLIELDELEKKEICEDSDIEFSNKMYHIHKECDTEDFKCDCYGACSQCRDEYKEYVLKSKVKRCQISININKADINPDDMYILDVVNEYLLMQYFENFIVSYSVSFNENIKIEIDFIERNEKWMEYIVYETETSIEDVYGSVWILVDYIYGDRKEKRKCII